MLRNSDIYAIGPRHRSEVRPTYNGTNEYSELRHHLVIVSVRLVTGVNACTLPVSLIVNNTEIYR